MAVKKEDVAVLPVQPKVPTEMETQKAQTPSKGLTYDELIAYQKQEGAADREARNNGENFVRYGGGYSSTPQGDGSVQLEKPMYGDLYYYNPGEKRTIKEGTSGADETFMSREDYALLQDYKQQWADANARGDQAAAQVAHAAAEALRAKYGYSGDTATRTDGGGYTTLGSLGLKDSDLGPTQAVNKDGGTSGGNDLTSLLEEWKKAAAEQANGQIDYAVSQAITELERALEDSKAQYREQAESVARDEMQGLDNSALYAEMRGDKGGIGQSQYNEIQAAAAQNRLAVQQAQTKLATDTSRQIADLRAQGEFEKADKLLEITQTYLSQLISLEQWQAEFGLSQAQFEASLEQWKAEYDLALKEFALGKEQWDKQFNYGVASDEKDLLLALMGSGMELTDEQLKTLGMTREQYDSYLRQQELEGAVQKPALTWAQVKAEIEAGNTSPNVLSAYEYYMGQGYQAETGGIAALSDLGEEARKIYETYTNGTGTPTPAMMAALVEEAGDKLSPEEQDFLLSMVGY